MNIKIIMVYNVIIYAKWKKTFYAQFIGVKIIACNMPTMSKSKVCLGEGGGVVWFKIFVM